MIKLSIIIPYYNVLEYTKELMKVLEPQLNDNVEVIIVDDGCNEYELDKFKAKVIHLTENSGGASIPRNCGLDKATGEYITFIDADDLVSYDYIQKILNKIKKDSFDYCLFSWKSIGAWKQDVIIKDNPPEWNCSVWNCIYKKNIINNIRFDKKLKMAEDYRFNLEARKGKKENIEDILYIYRSGVQDSLSSKGVIENDKFI